MANRPFRCPKCGNWYVKVPHEGECYLCAEGQHGRHSKTGEFDCHFGDASATVSERQMAQLLLECQESVRLIEALPRQVEVAVSRETVATLLREGEAAFNKIEKAVKDTPGLLRWSGVFEMPGRKDDEPDGRWKDLATLRELVKTNRRPKSDLTMMERSVAVCTEMADELPGLAATARLALAAARRVADGWMPPAKSAPVAKVDGFAKARAAKVAKRAQAKELAPA